MLRGDLDAIDDLERAIYPLPWPRQTLAGHVDSGRRCIWVATDGGRVIGYAGLDVDARQARVTTVTVDPAYRRRGVGLGLVEVLIADAQRRAAYRLRLEVAVSNGSARGLYRRLGFASIGVRRRYYGDEDAVIMELPLAAG